MWFFTLLSLNHPSNPIELNISHRGDNIEQHDTDITLTQQSPCAGSTITMAPTNNITTISPSPSPWDNKFVET